MRRRTKALLGSIFATCAVVAVGVAIVWCGAVPTDKRICVLAVAPHVKITYCELVKTTTNRPAIYFSRGRRVSQAYYKKEMLIYSYLYRFFKVRPVNQHVQESGAYSDTPLIQLTLAMRMSKEQRARSAGIGVRLTDANSVHYTSERGSFGGCSFNAGRSEGWIIDWGLGWQVPKLVPPIDIMVTNGDGSTLAHLKAAEW